MTRSGYLPGWAANYYQYLLPESNIYYNYSSAYGDGNKIIAINANTENLETCLKVLDMWCDPDAYLRIINGPDGEAWYSDGTDAYLTDASIEYLETNGSGGEGMTFSTGEKIPFGIPHSALTLEPIPFNNEESTMPFVIRIYLGYNNAEIRIEHTFLFDGDEQRDFVKGMEIRLDAVLGGNPYDKQIKLEAEDLTFHEAAVMLESRVPRVTSVSILSSRSRPSLSAAR